MDDEADQPVASEQRIHLQNLPTHIGFKQFRTFITKKLSLKPSKLRQCNDTAYMSFPSLEEANRVIRLLNSITYKGKILVAKLAAPEPAKGRRSNREDAPADNASNGTTPAETIPSISRSATPWAHLPYERQLKMKQDDSRRLTRDLISRMCGASVPKSGGLLVDTVLKQILPSPKHESYRNKCEFTIGKDWKGIDVCVGFVGGRFSEGKHFVLPIDEFTHISDHTKRIVAEFQDFVKESGFPAFDEYARSGFWRMLTVREFANDVMLIATAFPIAKCSIEPTKCQLLKEQFVARFISMDIFTMKQIRVTSIYWQELEHASDAVVYQHLAGAPYIYETIMDVRLRVSPSAFFQTNSAAVEGLYRTVAECCGFEMKSRMDEKLPPYPLLSASKDLGDEPVEEEEEVELVDEADEDGQSSAKRARTEAQIESGEPINGTPKMLLLDICCGTGAIGLCLLRMADRIEKGAVTCVGIEMVHEAVEDARINARHNGFAEKRCRFISGRVEDVFQNLKYHLPAGIDLDQADLIGIIDPPRAGIHQRVVNGIRKLAKLRRLVFVSCDPAAASKNLIDLCRPWSNKYEGEPFRLESIVPVDMFPQTKHCEWVVLLTR